MSDRRGKIIAGIMIGVFVVVGGLLVWWLRPVPPGDTGQSVAQSVAQSDAQSAGGTVSHDESDSPDTDATQSASPVAKRRPPTPPTAPVEGDGTTQFSTSWPTTMNPDRLPENGGFASLRLVPNNGVYADEDVWEAADAAAHFLDAAWRIDEDSPTPLVGVQEACAEYGTGRTCSNLPELTDLQLENWRYTLSMSSNMLYSVRILYTIPAVDEQKNPDRICLTTAFEINVRGWDGQVNPLGGVNGQEACMVRTSVGWRVDEMPKMMPEGPVEYFMEWAPDRVIEGQPEQ